MQATGELPTTWRRPLGGRVGAAVEDAVVVADAADAAAEVVDAAVDVAAPCAVAFS